MRRRLLALAAVPLVLAACGTTRTIYAPATPPSAPAAEQTNPAPAPIASTPASTPTLQLGCTLGYVFGTNNQYFTPDTTSAWWLYWTSTEGQTNNVDIYSVLQMTPAQALAYQGGDSQSAGPFPSKAAAVAAESANNNGGTLANVASPITPGNAVLQVTATNETSSMVTADSVNVDLYDADGDLLTTTTVGLGLAGIAPGVTATAAGGLSTIPAGAVSCQTTTYNQS